MHWVNDSIKLTSLGNIQTLFICTLTIWIPSSTLQYLLCSFYGWMWSCGHFIFVSFFGGEALVLSLSLYHYQITGEFWIDSTAWDFYSLYRLLRKFKRELSSLFVGKWTSFSLWNYEIVPPHPLPALLLAPFFALSLTPVPLSLLLNRTETLATQANGHLNLKVEVLPHWELNQVRENYN